MPAIQSVCNRSRRASAGSSDRIVGVKKVRARSTGIALTNQSASWRERLPAESSSHTAETRPPLISYDARPYPLTNRTPSPRSVETHGSIQASLVGRSSTRSRAPSLPWPIML